MMRMRKDSLSYRRFLALLLVFILTTVNLVIMLPTSAVAGINEWTPSGMQGTTVRVLEFSPDFANDKTVFAGTDYDGLHKSTDGGKTWTKTSLQATWVIYSISVSPNFANDRTVFAVAEGCIYRSTDGGETWSKVSDELTNMMSVAISPNYANDGTVLVGGPGIYKSTDRGDNWVAASAGLPEPNPDVTRISISPNFGADSTIFANAYFAGVFKSTDGGGNWTRIDPGFNYVTALDISPNFVSDGTVVVGTINDGLYRSTDGGQVWEQILQNVSFIYEAVAISPGYATDATILVGEGSGQAMRSTDGGTSWETTGQFGDEVKAVAIAPNFAAGGLALLGVNGGGIYAYGEDQSPPPPPPPGGCSWQTKAPMPTARLAAASTVANGKIFVMGGSPSFRQFGAMADVEAYDPGTDSWASMPSLIESRVAAGEASKGDIAYIVGGIDGPGMSYTNTVLAYNMTTGDSYIDGYLSAPSAFGDATILDNTIYYVGGDSSGMMPESIEAYDLQTKNSTVVATMPAPRRYAGAVTIGSKIYIVGGTDSNGAAVNTCWEYDPATNTFADKNPMPVALAGGIKSAAVHNGKLYVAGGFTAMPAPNYCLDAVLEYDPIADTWRMLNALPTARFGTSLQIVGDALYVIGGHDSQSAINTTEALCLAVASPPGDCSWQTKVPMPTPRFAPASGVVNGSIFVLGGSNRFDPPPRGALATVEKYDPATDTWEQLPPLIGERLAPGDATQGDIIYVVGGAQLFSVGAQANTVLAYNTTAETCTVAGYINTPRFLMDAEIINNKIYMFGGVAPGGVLLDSVEEFDLSTNTSTYKSPLPAPRSYTTVARVGDKLYVLGGLDASSAPTNTCWAYDPVTDTYTEKSPMPLARAFRQTVVHNNKIYLVGGMTEPGPTTINGFPDIQEYDPATDTWRIVGAVRLFRGAYVTEVVGDSLYVIGGRDNAQSLSLNEVCTFGTTPEPVTPPSAPTNIYAAPGDSYIDLSWDPVEGATGYIVHYRTNAGGPYDMSASAGGATSKRISLTNGQQYFFVVTANNSAGQSGYSTEVSAIPLAVPTINGPATSNDGTNIRLFGTADPNVGINIVDEIGWPVGMAIADSEGNWQATVSLMFGTRLLSAAEYVNGFTGSRSASHQIVISATVPVVGDGSASQWGNTYNVNPATGVMQVPTFAGTMLDIAVPVAGNPVAVTVEYLGNIYPLTDPDGDGIYTASIPIGFTGRGTWTPVNITVVDSNGTAYTQLLMEVMLIDPSGFVYDAQTGERVAGATVTLYAADGTIWDPAPYNHLKHQINPQVTDDEGCYGWDVPEGGYYVVVTRDGYYAFTSEIVTVPPPVLDLNIPLTPKTATTLEYVGTEEVQYSDSATVTVKLTDAAGNPLAGKPVAIEVAPGDSAVRTTALDGTASRTVSALAGASTHNVKASFNEDDDYLGSNLTSTFAEVAESASISYSGDVLAATTNGFTLKARVVGDDDASAGELSKLDPASVRFYLTNTDGTVLAPIAATSFTSISAGGALGNPETAEFSVTTNLSVGVYSIVVKLEANGYYTSPDSAPALGVSYDPSGGFATGGGWLKPDIESTLPDGRANFGFVAKYKDSASTGNLEFQYQDANINLKSKTIDWLAISDKQAQFQGTATMNGQGLYTFRVMAKDNGEPGAGVDSFDIRIWQGTNTEAVPIHKAKNTIAGGNIVVRKK